MSDDSQGKTIRWLVVFLVVLVAVAVAAMLISMIYTGGGVTGDHDFGMMGSFGGAWWLMMLIPVVVVIAIVIILVVALSDHPVEYVPTYSPTQTQQMEPLAILDRRLASGDISIEEHARLKNELTRR